MDARTWSRAELCRLSLVGLASGPPSRCFRLFCAACISVLLVRSRMNGTLLDWFSITLWAMAMDSLMVPKPLDPAISVAKPTKYWQSLSVFQSDGEKSFLVSMLSRCRAGEQRTSFFVNSIEAGLFQFGHIPVSCGMPDSVTIGRSVPTASFVLSRGCAPGPSMFVAVPLPRSGCDRGSGADGPKSVNRRRNPQSERSCRGASWRDAGAHRRGDGRAA